MKQTVSHLLLIAVVGAIVMFTNLGGPRLWDRDEPRNAGCAEEMMQRGDWVTPVFNDQTRTAKPVLLYWFIMSAYSVFGVNEFSARFWSALLAVGTSLATYAIGRRLFNARVGLWAGVILSSAMMFDVAGRAATPDSVLIFFATTAVMIYVLGAFRGADQSAKQEIAEPKYFPASWRTVVLMYAMMGMGVLAKGPVGLVLPTAVIGMFLLIMRLPPSPEDKQPTWRSRGVDLIRPFAPLHFLRTCWFMRPITAIVVVLLIAAPWYIWVGLRTDGAFLRAFFLDENFGRATRSLEGHNGNWLFYPVAILVGFFPWSVFATPTLLDAVHRIRRREDWKPGYVFACCWVGVYVGIFSLAQTKLPSYVTPCYPALALLTGCFVHYWTTNALAVARIWPWLSMSVLAVVGAGMLIALPIASSIFLPGEQWLGLVGAILLVGAIFCFVFLRTGHAHRAGLAFAVTAVVFTTAAFSWAVYRIDLHQQNHVLLQTIDDRSEQPRVASFGCLEPTWIFYGKRPVKEFFAGEADSLARFLQQSDDHFVITTDEHLASIQKTLPSNAAVLADAPYFLRSSKRLVVIGRSAVETRTAVKSGVADSSDLR